jgi:hypothetical protein
MPRWRNCCLEQWRRLVPAASLALSSQAGCELLGGFEDFSGAGGAAIQPHPCDVLPREKTDQVRSTRLVRVNVPNGTCFWVDRTEVTVEKYEEWQRSWHETVPPPPWDGTLCGWKTTPSAPTEAGDACIASVAQEESGAPLAPKKPIRCIDFCDAKAYFAAHAQLCRVSPSPPSRRRVQAARGLAWESAGVGGRSSQSYTSVIAGSLVER